jgi:hypothetical protein
MAQVGKLRSKKRIPLVWALRAETHPAEFLLLGLSSSVHIHRETKATFPICLHWIPPSIHPSIHPPTYPPTHPPIHPPTHPTMYPLTHSIQIPTQPFIFPSTHPTNIHPPIQMFTHPSIHPLTYPFTHPPTHSSYKHTHTHTHIHPAIQPSTHSSTRSQLCSEHPLSAKSGLVLQTERGTRGTPLRSVQAARGAMN